MTVAELIEELKREPQEAIVVRCNYESMYYVPVSGIQEFPKGVQMPGKWEHTPCVMIE